MENYCEKQDTFIGQNGCEIFFRTFSASDERARMVIAHGLGEHSGRYENLIRHLVPMGVSLWIPDFRGHGKSQGKRGHIISFDEYASDLTGMLAIARQGKTENQKMFLLGHSMGGLIALAMAKHSHEMIDGLIVSSPLIGMVIEVPLLKRFMGKVMSSLYPGLSLKNELDPSKISRDGDVVKAYIEDALVHSRVSARWFTETLAAMETVGASLSGLEIPFLMQLAGDDYLVRAASSRTFFERLETRDKTLYEYKTLYHEIYNAPNDQRAKVLTDLAMWLDAHIA
ncbi:MAG: lysophospholipase [Deltaproteobacteria bacterium]|nr:lysophospholipase [Deltaproteobacteria bacterium]MBW2592528.1 lysophospholipase [Deltaproteobacteria bacterium]